MDPGESPIKQLPPTFAITPSRSYTFKGFGGGQTDLLRPKDTPELYRLDNPFNRYQNSNSKWNEMTPVQMTCENFYVPQDSESKARADVYGNRKKSVMTELFNSARIEDDQGKFSNKQTGSGTFNGNEANKGPRSGVLRGDQMRIEEEVEFDNKSYNSGQGVDTPSKGFRAPVKQGRGSKGDTGFQKILFPNVNSPSNYKLFQSPMQQMKNADDALEMIMGCRDFFDRSYSKLLQSQKKHRDAHNSQIIDWDDEHANKTKLIIQNIFDSTEKLKKEGKLIKKKTDLTQPILRNNKRFSFANNNAEPRMSLLSNPNSQIGPNMSKLNLSLSPTPSFAADSFLINSNEKKPFGSKNLASLFLNAKNDISKCFTNPGTKLSHFGGGLISGFHGPTHLKKEKVARAGEREDLFNLNNSFCEIPELGESQLSQRKEFPQEKYLIGEMKEVLNSNSNKLLSNYQGSLSSLSNKKLAQFSNSEKRKSRIKKGSKFNSNSKENKQILKKKKQSSSIDGKSKRSNKKTGLLFINSNEKLRIEPGASLIPLDPGCRSICQSSTTRQQTHATTTRELSSPFVQTLSPFFNPHKMPSTATNTFSQTSKVNKKNFEQLQIQGFTTVSSSKPEEPRGKGREKGSKDPGVFDSGEIRFDDFGVTLDKQGKKRQKTPDPVKRKLGKRGGSDAKKCQTPGSFLASNKKCNKKVRKR